MCNTKTTQNLCLASLLLNFWILCPSKIWYASRISDKMTLMDSKYRLLGYVLQSEPSVSWFLKYIYRANHKLTENIIRVLHFRKLLIPGSMLRIKFPVIIFIFSLAFLIHQWLYQMESGPNFLLLLQFSFWRSSLLWLYGGVKCYHLNYDFPLSLFCLFIAICYNYP